MTTNSKKIDRDNFKDQLNYIKSTIEPHYLLEQLGIDIERETPKEIRSSCPIHGGDNRSAFRFNKETNTWVCFTHKCHDLHGNDVIALVMGLTGRDFMSAVEYLKQFVPNLDDANYVSFKRTREIENFVRSCETTPVKPKYVNESSLKDFRSLGADFFIRQGFKQSTMDYFEIGYGWTDKNGIVRCVIPIRDDKGELVAYSLRDTTNSLLDDDFKYILTPGFNKQSCLYNLNNAKKYGFKLPLIVVEGFKSVWKLHEYGIKNVVAAMGSSITEGQQLLMYLHALKGAVVFFDNDKAGVEGTIKACDDFSGKLDVRPVFIQEVSKDGVGLDPADLTKEQVYEYLDTYF